MSIFIHERFKKISILFYEHLYLSEHFDPNLMRHRIKL